MIVLHIGLPKTGSSAIQAMLRERAAELEHLGIHYALTPEAAGDRHGVSSGNGRDLVRYLDPRRRPPDFSLEAFEGAFDRPYLSDAPSALISSEFLASAGLFELIRLKRTVLAGRPVAVVAAIRNLYDHAFSSWAQLVKRHACTRSFAHFLEASYTNPQLKALRTYGRVFGPDSLRLLAYDRCRDDLCERFLEAIGAPGVGAPPAPDINRSLSRHELEVQLALNRIHHSPAAASAIADGLLALRPRARRAWRRDGEIARRLHERFDGEIRSFAADNGLSLDPLLDFPGSEAASRQGPKPAEGSDRDSPDGAARA